MRFFLPPAATALILAPACVTLAPTTARAQERDPVLFVHGYGGSADDWETMINDFTDDGWNRDALYALDYDSDASNVQTAELIEQEVSRTLDETGHDKVDMVTHSMGGLSSRWYLKFLDGHRDVDDWTSLAGPDQGSTVEPPCVNTSPSCQEVVVGSSFLQRLDSGDPTPGDVTYTTFRSLCDLIVRPSTNVTLPGAENHRVGCVGHISFLRDAGVSEGVRATLS